MKLTKQECKDSLSKIITVKIYEILKNEPEALSLYENDCNVLEQLIEEHFSSSTRVEAREQLDMTCACSGQVENPPLKLEEIENAMVIWDNEEEEYIKCYEFFNGQWLYLRFGNEDMYVFVFTENRFYRREVKDE